MKVAIINKIKLEMRKRRINCIILQFENFFLVYGKKNQNFIVERYKDFQPIYYKLPFFFLPSHKFKTLKANLIREKQMHLYYR